MRIIRQIIFCSAVIFIGLSILVLTIGQIVPYEFADYNVMHKFYDIVMIGFPVAILLTLFGTIKRDKSKTRGLSVIASTVLISIAAFFIMVNLMFSIGFGAWTTVETIYRNKTNDHVIKEQLYDVGAFGYGGRRTVEITPFLKYWILPKKIDTTSIDKREWIPVKEQDEVKFP